MRLTPFYLHRTGSYAESAEKHLIPALASGAVLLLANLPLGEVLPDRWCLFAALTGLPCPFCGFTRAASAMAGGDWALALSISPLTAVLYVLAALILAWHGSALLLGVRLEPVPLLRAGTGRGTALTWLATLLLLLNWTYRLILGAA